MASLTIFRGDSYEHDRPLYLIELDALSGGPFDLSGCTVRTTFKPKIVPADEDPDDSTAQIKADIVLDANGAVTRSSGLVLGTLVGNTFVVTAAKDGKLAHLLSKAESAAIEAGVPLVSDVEVTDSVGRVHTFLFEESLTARDGVTNRSE